MSADGVIPTPAEPPDDLARRENVVAALCGEPKDGGYRLHCELRAGHEGWHRGVWHSRQEVTYLGSHHVVETTESVTWEPVDRLREAVNRIMSGHDANPVATRKDVPS